MTVTLREAVVDLLQQIEETTVDSYAKFNLSNSIERMIIDKAKSLGFLIPTDMDEKTQLLKINAQINEGISYMSKALFGHSQYYANQFAEAQKHLDEPYQNNKAFKSSI